MKIQELAIIFIIIILPISLLLSVYTQFQIQTINMQSIYDSKLTIATYDSIRAFQLNSANSTTSDIANSKMRDLEASIATFRNSIMTAFELNGYTEEEINNYIPALVYTLYDGFYIYSPYENVANEDGTITLEDEDIEQIYGLKPYISYSCRYKYPPTSTNPKVDVVITYALDNYITVQGVIDNKYVNKSGYLIDDVEIVFDKDSSTETVVYNGITIPKETLSEKIRINNEEKLCHYAKINGTKYYLVEDYIQNNDGTELDAIVFISNGAIKVQYKEGDAQFISYSNTIKNNDSAQQYYKNAQKFTDWFKSTDLMNLTYNCAYDEVITITKNGEEETKKVNTEQIWSENNTYIFKDENNNFENELSNFNQHRLAVIRHKIETNLAIAISNYNEYSSVSSNVFQMPELKENEWDYIINNISVISFLQGLPIGGKYYNGYSIVTNSESEEVVLEENIYILGNDNKYHRMGDKGLEDEGAVNAGNYGTEGSEGRESLDFERVTIVHEGGSSYYYPLNDYNASYDSIIMQNNVTTYEDIYTYVEKQGSVELKTAFYTALGRERNSTYNVNNINTYYSVLVVGKSSNSVYQEHTSKITEILNEDDGIRATYIFNSNESELIKYIDEQKQNYNLIIIDYFVWPLGNISSKLSEIASSTNLITISNDQTGLPIMSSGTTGSTTVVPQITELGKSKLGEISITGLSDTQAAFKFKDDVEVFYTGTYSGAIRGQYDLIGCWQNGNYKWIHSQISLNYNNNNHMKLLKSLVKYAMNGG